MSTPNFPCAAWITRIKENEGSTTYVVFILWAGVGIMPAGITLETKQNSVPFTSYSSSHHSGLTAHSKWTGTSLTATQLPYKNKSPEKTSEEKAKRQGTNTSLFLAKYIFFLLAEKTPSCTHCLRQAGTTLLSTLTHTIRLHLLLSRAVLLFDEDLLTLGDCTILRCLTGYRAFHPQVSVSDSSPACAARCRTPPWAPQGPCAAPAGTGGCSGQGRERSAPGAAGSRWRKVDGAAHRPRWNTVLLTALLLLH